jgi:hypothetical protein
MARASEPRSMKWTRIVALLPAGKLFDRIFAEGIKPAADQVNLSCRRLTPEFSESGQLGAICQELETSDLVIADVTARSPNVMFLAGYAQGIGREILLITQFAEDFPFDRAKHAPIIYGCDTSFLKNELLAYLRGEVKAVDQPSSNPREQFLATFGDLLKKHAHEHRGEIYLENPTTYVLVGQDMDLPLVQDLARRGRELGLRIKLM